MPHINSAKTTTPSPRLWIQMGALDRFGRGPSLSPHFSTSRWNHTAAHVCSRKKKRRKIDAEVGKVYHMRVTWSRQHRSRHYPVSVSTTPQPYPNPWPIPSHVEHGPWLWLGNRWKSWGAKALSPMCESCGLDRPLAVDLAETIINTKSPARWPKMKPKMEEDWMYLCMDVCNCKCVFM